MQNQMEKGMENMSGILKSFMCGGGVHKQGALPPKKKHLLSSLMSGLPKQRGIYLLVDGGGGYVDMYRDSRNLLGLDVRFRGIGFLGSQNNTEVPCVSYS